MKKIALSVLMTATLIYADFTRSNGIVTDNKTSLQWQDDYSDNGGSIKEATWIDAINYCENLSLGGYSDWRLPNIKELLSIADRSRYNPAIDSLFQKVTSDGYWSATANANRIGYAWIVYFNDGYSNYRYKFGTRYVRCVRGGQ